MKEETILTNSLKDETDKFIQQCKESARESAIISLNKAYSALENMSKLIDNKIEHATFDEMKRYIIVQNHVHSAIRKYQIITKKELEDKQ